MPVSLELLSERQLHDTKVSTLILKKISSLNQFEATEILLAPSSSTVAQERFLSQVFVKLHTSKMVNQTNFVLVVTLGVWVAYQSYHIISQHIFNERQSHDHLRVCRRVPVYLTLTWWYEMKNKIAVPDRDSRLTRPLPNALHRSRHVSSKMIRAWYRL